VSIIEIEKLIALANGNANENESRTAAMLACKKIQAAKLRLIGEPDTVMQHCINRLDWNENTYTVVGNEIEIMSTHPEKGRDVYVFNPYENTWWVQGGAKTWKSKGIEHLLINYVNAAPPWSKRNNNNKRDNQ